MHSDMCIPCDNGLVNLRVGAIILKDGKLLMAGNKARPSHLYSVGGRIKFGETAKEAVIREVCEETGYRLETDRLGFVHENYFYGDADSNHGKLIYEISFYFYMKVPEDFSPVSNSHTEDEEEEFLKSKGFKNGMLKSVSATYNNSLLVEYNKGIYPFI